MSERITIECLFTHCWNPGDCPISISDKGKKVSELQWLIDEIDDDDRVEELKDHVLVSARISEPNEDEIYAWIGVEA